MAARRTTPRRCGWLPPTCTSSRACFPLTNCSGRWATVVITEVSGLHAGANPVSGDFSLLSKGYTIKDGQRDQPLERITVAGNFYELLKNIRAFASDLRFPYGPMGSASADAGEMTVSGKA